MGDRRPASHAGATAHLSYAATHSRRSSVHLCAAGPTSLATTTSQLQCPALPSGRPPTTLRKTRETCGAPITPRSPQGRSRARGGRGRGRSTPSSPPGPTGTAPPTGNQAPPPLHPIDIAGKAPRLAHTANQASGNHMPETIPRRPRGRGNEGRQRRGAQDAWYVFVAFRRVAGGRPRVQWPLSVRLALHPPWGPSTDPHPGKALAVYTSS